MEGMRCCLFHEWTVHPVATTMVQLYLRHHSFVEVVVYFKANLYPIQDTHRHARPQMEMATAGLAIVNEIISVPAPHTFHWIWKRRHFGVLELDREWTLNGTPFLFFLCFFCFTTTTADFCVLNRSSLSLPFSPLPGAARGREWGRAFWRVLRASLAVVIYCTINYFQYEINENYNRKQANCELFVTLVAAAAAAAALKPIAVRWVASLCGHLHPLLRATVAVRPQYCYFSCTVFGATGCVCVCRQRLICVMLSSKQRAQHQPTKHKVNSEIHLLQSCWLVSSNGLNGGG